MKKLNIVFMGTPDFGVKVLEGLIEKHNVIAVVSQPDKKVGRKHVLRHTPIKTVALDHNIKVLQPSNIKDDYEKIKDLNPDMIVTCAYGQFVPDNILNIPKYGSINVHASLLPKYRGGAPIHRAIINGDSKTGVTIMYMAKKMDAGDIISQREVIIKEDDNLESLHDKLSVVGRDLLLDTIEDIIACKSSRVKQDENLVSYAYNITREDERLDFNKTTIEIYNHIRGLSPLPGAFTTLDGKLVKVYSSYMSDRVFTTKENGEIVAIYKDGIGVSTKDGEIIITQIKIEGKNKVKVADYLNGIDKDSLIGKVFK